MKILSISTLISYIKNIFKKDNSKYTILPVELVSMNYSEIRTNIQKHIVLNKKQMKFIESSLDKSSLLDLIKLYNNMNIITERAYIVYPD